MKCESSHVDESRGILLKEVPVKLPASVVRGWQVVHIPQSEGYPERVERATRVHNMHNILGFNVLQQVTEDIVSEPRYC